MEEKNQKKRTPQSGPVTVSQNLVQLFVVVILNHKILLTRGTEIDEFQMNALAHDVGWRDNAVDLKIGKKWTLSTFG